MTEKEKQEQFINRLEEGKFDFIREELPGEYDLTNCSMTDGSICYTNFYVLSCRFGLPDFLLEDNKLTDCSLCYSNGDELSIPLSRAITILRREWKVC